MADADHPAPDRGARTSTYSAPALEKGFDVVELLATAEGGLTISEIAARLGLTISQIFRMIVVMERRGWLYKEAESDRYRVTYKVLDLAFRATPAQELAYVATPLMHSLAARAEQSCHLVVKYGTKGIVIVRQENPGPVGLAVRLGTTVDLVASSSGHVLLAYSEPADLEATLAAVTYPPNFSESELKKALNRVRKRGFEMMASARTAGVRDISRPIFGFDNKVVAALTIPFLAVIDGSQQVDFEEAQILLAETAGQISEALGCCLAPAPNQPAD